MFLKRLTIVSESCLDVVHDVANEDAVVCGVGCEPRDVDGMVARVHQLQTLRGGELDGGAATWKQKTELLVGSSVLARIKKLGAQNWQLQSFSAFHFSRETMHIIPILLKRVQTISPQAQ